MVVGYNELSIPATAAFGVLGALTAGFGWPRLRTIPGAAWTGPLGTGHTVIRRHVECSPCFLRECPLDFRCMKAVTPEYVSETVRNLLMDGGLGTEPVVL